MKLTVMAVVVDVIGGTDSIEGPVVRAMSCWCWTVVNTIIVTGAYRSRVQSVIVTGTDVASWPIKLTLTYISILAQHLPFRWFHSWFCYLAENHLVFSIYYCVNLFVQ